MDNHRFPERQRPEFRILLQRPDCSAVLGVGSVALQLRGGQKEQRGSVRWRSGSDLGSVVRSSRRGTRENADARAQGYSDPMMMDDAQSFVTFVTEPDLLVVLLCIATDRCGKVS